MPVDLIKKPLININNHNKQSERKATIETLLKIGNFNREVF